MHQRRGYLQAVPGHRRLQGPRSRRPRVPRSARSPRQRRLPLPQTRRRTEGAARRPSGRDAGHGGIRIIWSATWRHLPGAVHSEAASLHSPDATRRCWVVMRYVALHLPSTRGHSATAAGLRSVLVVSSDKFARNKTDDAQPVNDFIHIAATTSCHGVVMMTKMSTSGCEGHTSRLCPRQHRTADVARQDAAIVLLICPRVPTGQPLMLPPFKSLSTSASKDQRPSAFCLP